LIPEGEKSDTFTGLALAPNEGRTLKGCEVFELEPISEKLMAFHRAHAVEYFRIAEAISSPRFSDYCIRELTKLLGSKDAATLVEAGRHSSQVWRCIRFRG